MAEETILLKVEIDQSNAQKQLVATEKSILAIKKQQQELTKEYKAGKISEDEYVKSNLAIQRAIKTESDQKRTLTKLVDTESNSRNALKLRVSELAKEYDNLNTQTEEGAKREKELATELKALNDQISKTSGNAGLFKDQIGNYPKVLGDAINQVKPFGLSIDGVAGSLGKFINPATAAVGILAGLGAAYAKSSSGAKDLAFAQDRLAFITSTVVERFGMLVSGTGEGGDGILNKFIDLTVKASNIIPGFGVLLGSLLNDINEQSKVAAQAGENLRKLQIEGVRAQGFAKFFEQAAENARRLRDDEANSIEDRLKATETISANLLANQKVRLNVINQEIEAIKAANVNWQNQDGIVLQIEQKRAEARDIEEEINGKLTENVTARKSILKLAQEARIEAQKAAEEERKATAADDRAQRRAIDTADVTIKEPEGLSALKNAGQDQIDANQAILTTLEKHNEEFREKELAREKYFAAQKEAIKQAELAATVSVLGAAASLFDQQSSEYKIFATAQTLISTYAAATKAYEAAFVPPTLASPAIGAAYAAAAVAQGLANVAAINGVQFAEGGYTGPGTKYQPAGIVHAGEVVWNQRDVALAGGPAAADAMRPTFKGYADGGFVAQQNISPYQMAMITANAIKNLPQPVVGVREFNKVANRVAVRESVSSR